MSDLFWWSFGIIYILRSLEDILIIKCTFVDNIWQKGKQINTTKSENSTKSYLLFQKNLKKNDVSRFCFHQEDEIHRYLVKHLMDLATFGNDI